MRCIRLRRQAGASLAETALIITVVAVAAAVALSFLGSSSDSTLEEAGKGIHDAPAGGTPGGGTGSGAGDETGGGGGSGGSGGGHPAPTTSTTTPGSTTIAPTTTAARTTTTWPTPVPATATLSGGQGVRSGSSRWNASADLRLAVDGSPGGSMAGTATVLVESWKANGQRSTTTIQVAVSADGRADIGTGPYTRTGTSRIDSVRYTVVSIDLVDGRGWDGDQPSISISRPA